MYLNLDLLYILSEFSDTKLWESEDINNYKIKYISNKDKTRFILFIDEDKLLCCLYDKPNNLIGTGNWKGKNQKLGINHIQYENWLHFSENCNDTTKSILKFELDKFYFPENEILIDWLNKKVNLITENNKNIFK